MNEKWPKNFFKTFKFILLSLVLLIIVMLNLGFTTVLASVESLNASGWIGIVLYLIFVVLNVLLFLIVCFILKKINGDILEFKIKGYLILLGILSLLFCTIIKDDEVSKYYLIDSIFIILVIITALYLLSKKIFKFQKVKNKKIIKILLIAIFTLFIVISFKPTDLNSFLYSNIGSKINGFKSKDVYIAVIKEYNSNKNFISDVSYLYKLNSIQYEEINYISVKSMDPEEYSDNDFKKLPNVLSIDLDFDYSKYHSKELDLSNNKYIYKISDLNYKNVIINSNLEYIMSCEIENLKIIENKKTSYIMSYFDLVLKSITVEDYFIDFGKNVHLNNVDGRDSNSDVTFELSGRNMVDLNIKNIKYKNLKLEVYDKNDDLKKSGKLEIGDKLIFTKNNAQVFIDILVTD